MLNISASGNLGRDPELKQIGGNDAATFSIASRTGKDETTWINCTVFGKRSQVIMQFYKKGSKVSLSGKGTLRTYQNNEGVQKASLEVVVSDFDLPERKQETINSTFDNNDNF
jgi:single-strand DNA-binding protein